MKKTLLFIFSVVGTLTGFAQTYSSVSVNDIQKVISSKLANCNDTSSYLNDTVIVHGIVTHKGDLTEIPSGSVTGGHRPALHIVDTANNGQMGDFRGLQVHGVYDGNKPVSVLNSLTAGTVVKITGTVGRYRGETQIYPISNSAVQALTVGTAPTSISVSVGDLNDATKKNQLETGEKYEGSFVELQNVTVVAVNFFSSGNRVSFDVADANGNTINVSDRFLVQKLSSYTSVHNPNKKGSFVAPPVGTVYSSLKGIILHSENGCTGQNGRGYEINPFDASHYVIGVAPPNISDITRTPTFPKTTDAPVIKCKATDFDGTISSVKLHYAVGATNNTYSTVNFTLVSGTTDEYQATIPAQSEGAIVKYYITATDNANNTTTSPFTPAAQTTKNALHYTVRDNGPQIIDIQRVLNNKSGKSVYDGETVTVKGVVTSSIKDFDLGYIYIQQPGQNKWAGISLLNSADLFKLYRGEEVEVTGTVQEISGSLSTTAINVTSLSKTGKRLSINPVVLSPTDSAAYANKGMRPYEAMLVEMSNGSNKIYISNNNRGFGEYQIATTQTANDAHSTRVLAGRQSSSANSSLWVSLISDKKYSTTDKKMEVDSVITEKGMTVDKLKGILFESYGSFKVLPRNNDDIVGLADKNGNAIKLDTTNLDTGSVSVTELNGVEVISRAYPNPAQDQIKVELEGYAKTAIIRMYDLSGRQVNATYIQTIATINASEFSKGVYFLNITTEAGEHITTKKIIIE